MGLVQAIQLLKAWEAIVIFNRGTVDVTVWKMGRQVNVWAGSVVEAVEKLKIELNQ